MKIKRVEKIDGQEVILLAQIYTNTRIYQELADESVYYICINDIVITKLVSKSPINIFLLNYLKEEE